jgi:hypothetical protein
MGNQTGGQVASQPIKQRDRALLLFIVLNFILSIFTFTYMCMYYLGYPTHPPLGRAYSAFLFSNFVEEKT